MFSAPYALQASLVAFHAPNRGKFANGLADRKNRCPHRSQTGRRIPESFPAILCESVDHFMFQDTDQPGLLGPLIGIIRFSLERK